MKLYLLVTCALFGIMAALHVWRAIAEWPASGPDLRFVVVTVVMVVVPGALSWWAWQVLRRLPSERK
jgi:hypothetical protein